MTIADRVALYAACGLDLSVTTDGRLSVKGPAMWRELARPSLLKHREAIIAHLETAEVERAA